MSKRTSGLLKVEEDENGVYLVSSKGEVVLNTDNTDLDQEEMDANIRHVAECWNTREDLPHSAGECACCDLHR